MRITVITTGDPDDVKPFAELAKGLVACGYDATLVTPAQLVMEYDDIYGEVLSILPCSVNIFSFVQHIIKNSDPGINDIMELIRVMRHVDLSRIDAMTLEFLNACTEADFIISHVATSIFAQSIAESRGIPFFTGVPDHKMSQRLFPSRLSPSRFDFSGVYNRVTGRVTGYVLYQMFAPAINKFRTESLQLKPHSALSYQETGMRLQPTISATKTVVRKVSESWDPNIIVTHSWNTHQGLQEAVQAVETQIENWTLTSH